MSLVFNPPNPTQPTLSYSSVNTPENLEVWTKSGLNIYNTSLGNVSIGTTSVATYKLNVNGSLNFTTLYQSGTLIDFSNFATDSELTSGLATKQNIINSYVLTGGTNGSLGFSSGTLTLVLPSNYSTLSIASLTSGTSIIYKGTELSTTLNNYTPFTALLSSNFVNFPQLLSCNYANYTQLNNCNYITNSTTGLVNYPSYSAIGLSNFVRFPQLLSCNFVNFPQLSSCNYITNSTSSLNNYPSYSAIGLSNFVNFPQLLSCNYANYTQLNSCNYITNATSSLNNYPSYSAIGLSNFVNFPQLLSSNYANYTQLNSCNYITNATTGLNNYPSYSAIGLSNFVNFPQLLSSNYANYTQLNSCNYITNSTSGLTNYTRTGLDPAYLLKSGGTMTGQITGVTTLNGTTGIFGTISTTNNTNVGAPTNGVYGGTGDKIILWAGVAGTTLPYSLGINASTLWYSVPTGATHKFYSGGGNPKMTILGSGNIGIGTETPSELLYIYSLAGNNAIQSLDSSAGSGLAILRLISGNATTNRGSFLDFYNNFASTSVPRWRIVNNYDYDTKDDLRIVNGNTQATLTILQNGNVSIGTNNTNSKLNIYSTTQTQPRISLTGIEYYTGANTNNDGVGFLLGVNRTDNRQLFICDTAKTAINTTNSMIRMGVGGSSTFIDSTATDGLTRLPFNIGGNAFNCQANSYGSTNKILKFHNVQVADDRPFMENLIFNEGAIVGGTFAGDTFMTSYWGVSILLNSGGFTNGVGGGNNTRSYEPGFSAFTINMRSSTTQTTFDRRLFRVMPDGNTTINGILYINKGDTSYIRCGANSYGYFLNIGSINPFTMDLYDATTSTIYATATGSLHLNPSSASNRVLINGFNASGFLGVGNANTADAKLHVGSGSTSTGNIYQRLLSLVLGDGTATQVLSDVCAIFDSSVWTKSKFTTSSDERIKKNIQDINDDTALQKILLIQPKTYEYIDKLDKGNDIVYGFIAQQIKEVIPEAVKIEKCIIPNIYKFCNYINDAEGSHSIITLPPEQINKLKINDEIEIIIEDDNNKRLVKIIEINNDDNTIKINESLNIIKTTNKTEEESLVFDPIGKTPEGIADEIPQANEVLAEQTKECFVYGSKVDDFHTLDKNYIYTLNVCATQELYRIIQLQEERIRILEEKLASL